jgi:glutamate dehydrogenase
VTVQDVDEALLDTVCSRLREHLRGDEAVQAETFARQYYRWVSPEDIAERSELDVYGAALAHFDLARRRTPGTTKVRIYNPRFDAHGWRSLHTAVEIVTDDMPFLTDSVAMELNRRGFGVHLIIHPVMRMRRDDQGRLREVLPHGTEAEDAVAESVIHAEVARQTDPAELSQLERHLQTARLAREALETDLIKLEVIGDDETRFECKSSRNTDPLTLAAREFVRETARHLRRQADLR